MKTPQINTWRGRNFRPPINAIKGFYVLVCCETHSIAKQNFLLTIDFTFLLHQQAAGRVHEFDGLPPNVHTSVALQPLTELLRPTQANA